MWLDEWLLKRYGIAFSVFPPEAALTEVQNYMDMKLLDDMYVIVKFSQRSFRFVRFGALDLKAGAEADNALVRLLDIPMRQPDAVLTSQTGLDADEVETLLKREAPNVFLVLEADEVVGVLVNPTMSGAANEVLFSAYHSGQVAAKQRHNLLVYAHLDSARASIRADAEHKLTGTGASSLSSHMTRSATSILPGSMITIVPEAPDVSFNPPTLTKRWEYEWVCFDFDFTVSENLVDQMALIRLSIQVAGIEVASIQTGVAVVDAGMASITASPVVGSAYRYQSIFISYSRKDADVVRAYRIAQIAAGNEIFVDVESLRSGDDWQKGLGEAIQKTDIFQLFWSLDAAASSSVRWEWEYCLKERCGGNVDQCPGLIRPVYWQIPIPAVPPELKALNFRYVPLNCVTPPA